MLYFIEDSCVHVYACIQAASCFRERRELLKAVPVSVSVDPLIQIAAATLCIQATQCLCVLEPNYAITAVDLYIRCTYMAMV